METKEKVVYYGREQDTSNIFSTFSGREGYDSESFDFGWGDTGLGWTKSWKKSSYEWQREGGITEEDIPFLFAKFGLTKEMDNRLSYFEMARYLSPAELIGIRRVYEQQTGASRLVVVSDRLGGHIPAEMVTGLFS